jgi:hypothetical protein
VSRDFLNQGLGISKTWFWILGLTQGLRFGSKFAIALQIPTLSKDFLIGSQTLLLSRDFLPTHKPTCIKNTDIRSIASKLALNDV